MEIDENADVVNVLVTTGQLVPTLGKLLLFKLDGAFKATCESAQHCCHLTVTWHGCVYTHQHLTQFCAS